MKLRQRLGDPRWRCQAWRVGAKWLWILQPQTFAQRDAFGTSLHDQSRLAGAVWSFLAIAAALNTMCDWGTQLHELDHPFSTQAAPRKALQHSRCVDLGVTSVWMASTARPRPRFDADEPSRPPRVRGGEAAGGSVSLRHGPAVTIKSARIPEALDRLDIIA